MNLCKRSECGKPAARNMIYCSRDCAPYGHLAGTRTPYDPIVKSTIKEPGGRLGPFSRDVMNIETDGKPNTRETLSTENENASSAEKIIGNTMKKNSSENETAGETSPLGNVTSIMPSGSYEDNKMLSDSRKSSNGNSDETQLMAFIAPLPGSDAERSASNNLIDSTLEQLHDLMKSVAKDEPRARNNPQSIQAVCNVAKQMRDLMILKLNVVKTARKLQEGKGLNEN